MNCAKFSEFNRISASLLQAAPYHVRRFPRQNQAVELYRSQLSCPPPRAVPVPILVALSSLSRFEAVPARWLLSPIQEFAVGKEPEYVRET